MPTKRKYDYKCGACGHTATLELTMDDYEVQRGTGIVCGNCSHLMSRVYDVQVPRSTQLKGHYNSSYEGQKEFAKITKDGGEEVGK